MSRRFAALLLELMVRPGPLRSAQRELIATVVAAELACRNCLAHHGACLRADLVAEGMASSDAARVVQSIAEHRAILELAAADLAIAAFAKKLTLQPHAMSEADVVALRDLDLPDRAIYDIANITGLFAYVIRLASGLGLPLESNWAHVYPQMVGRSTPVPRANG